MSVMKLATAAVVLVFFLAVAFPVVVRAEVSYWTAQVLTDTYFRANATCRVTLHGNGTDVTVRWSANSTSFAETSALVQVCNAYGARCANYSRPSPASPADSWLWTLTNAVPADYVLHKVIVSLLNTTTGQTISNGSYVAFGTVGQSAVMADVFTNSSIDAPVVTVGATPLNYTCKWTARITANNSDVIVQAPLVFRAQDVPRCVVPSFDKRLAAGTNFTMALLMGASGPNVVPPGPGTPFVWSTNAIATGVSLPGKLCSGQNVSINGFFFAASAGYDYSCAFGQTVGTVSAITMSPTLVVCSLPNSADTVTVTSIDMWQRASKATTSIGNVKASFEYSASCTNTGGGGGDDDWPYWAWILVGLGAVAALTTLMGLVALVYVTWFRSGGEGDYEQLIYADNPIHYHSEQQLPALDRKTFSV